MIRHPRALIAAAVIGLVVLVGCSSGHSSMNSDAMKMASIPEGADFNATDVGFAQGMIPHHAQAVEMADMAIAANASPAVLTLAQKIKAAQNPEIETMTTWLRQWDQPVPAMTSSMSGGGHDMTGMSGMMMDGMMTQADMTRLSKAKGAEFDRLWLELMVQHHEGAVRMANDELASGKNAQAQTLARAIIASQTAEIEQMNKMLASMPN
ncbi:MAG: DUF305 domain-containing protein [Ilumatobacteraceae bacterium]